MTRKKNDTPLSNQADRAKRTRSVRQPSVPVEDGEATNHFTFKANFPKGRGCRRKAARAEGGPPAPPAIPRISRLLALAHYLETQVRSGTVKDYAELARFLGVSRARITQILNLLLLAPDVQEAILFLPPTETGRIPLTEHDLRRLAAEPNWSQQRKILLTPASPTQYSHSTSPPASHSRAVKW